MGAAHQKRNYFSTSREGAKAQPKGNGHMQPIRSPEWGGRCFRLSQESLEALEGGWIFQGKNKHNIKIDLTCPEADHQPQLVA
ncbi:unnamed protein product [Sphagnum balticum]